MPRDPELRKNEALRNIETVTNSPSTILLRIFNSLSTISKPSYENIFVLLLARYLLTLNNGLQSHFRSSSIDNLVRIFFLRSHSPVSETSKIHISKEQCKDSLQACHGHFRFGSLPPKGFNLIPHSKLSAVFFTSLALQFRVNTSALRIGSQRTAEQENVGFGSVETKINRLRIVVYEDKNPGR